MTNTSDLTDRCARAHALALGTHFDRWDPRPLGLCTPGVLHAWHLSFERRHTPTTYHHSPLYLLRERSVAPGQARPLPGQPLLYQKGPLTLCTPPPGESRPRAARGGAPHTQHLGQGRPHAPRPGRQAATDTDHRPQTTDHRPRPTTHGVLTRTPAPPDSRTAPQTRPATRTSRDVISPAVQTSSQTRQPGQQAPLLKRPRRPRSDVI